MNIQSFGQMHNGVLFIDNEHQTAWLTEDSGKIHPHYLKKVKVFNCENPLALLQKISAVWGSTVEDLQIIQCTGLISLRECAFTKLERFELGDVRSFSVSLFAELESMCQESLKMLSVWSCEKFTSLNQRFPSLEDVVFTGSSLDDSGLKQLSQVNAKTLKKLDITGTQVLDFTICDEFIYLEKLETDVKSFRNSSAKKSTQNLRGDNASIPDKPGAKKCSCSNKIAEAFSKLFL